MKNIIGGLKSNWKTILVDLLYDIVGSFLIAIGLYKVAVALTIPTQGVNGIAQLIHFFWNNLPIGTTVMALNIPIILICGKILGLKFMLKSVKTMLIQTFFIDVIATRIPDFTIQEPILAAISMGVLFGVGYALIYLRETSTGGSDFIIMAIRAKKPQLSIGKITAILESSILVACGIVMGNNSVDNIIYGLIATYITSVVIDKVMYGFDACKVTFVVTEHGQAVTEKIHKMIRRGSTILKGSGSFSKADKQVVMCACSAKQMHMVQKAIKEIDPNAFMMTMDSNEVRGEGFKPH